MVFRGMSFVELCEFAHELHGACIVMNVASKRENVWLREQGLEMLQRVLDRYEDKDFREVQQ